MLTPLDLNGKTFSKGFRGYDTEEVNQFFSQISRDYERLYQDNVELKDSVERVSAKLEYYQRMESTMQSTLVVAQETADEVKKSSLQKAQVMTRETELACNKQKESTVSFCNKLRADTEAEITRMKSEADAYAEKVRKMADEYASKTRGEADDYGKTTRNDADSYALGLRSKTDSSTSKLREEAQSFVDKMKSLAEIEVARMKVETEDNCKSQLADSREQARTLTAEASAHANQVMADANQQSQNIVAEATQKAHEMIANAQKQSQDMVAEARQKSQDMMADANQKAQTMIAEATQKSHQMVAEATEQSRSMVQEATERSNSMIHDATERSQKMVFVAETKAAAAMDTYNSMVNKANSQSKQLKSLLQSQLSLYENFEAEYAIDQMVQPKLQAVRKAEPVLETKAEPVNKDNDIAEAALAGETVMEAPEVKSSAEPGKEEPAKINFPEAAKANAAAAAEEKSVLADKDSAPADEDLKPAADDKSSVSGSNGYGGKRKPLFSRFNPRSPMVFNRNGFPRKNADLRVALSELQKSAEPRLQSVKATPEPAGETVKPESQNSVPAPEGNKES